jgi:hypothetical protein
MLFEIDAVLLAVAGIVTPFQFRAGRAIYRQAVGDAAAKLAEAGLETTGDLLGRFNARTQEGRDPASAANDRDAGF